ncbi:hypothetical protein CKO11_03745 [Rhodobacter sp. TJ_12]|nr:hypothetical protein [Rhodobacter sp. TJ_12]
MRLGAKDVLHKGAQRVPPELRGKAGGRCNLHPAPRVNVRPMTRFGRLSGAAAHAAANTGWL